MSEQSGKFLNMVLKAETVGWSWLLCGCWSPVVTGEQTAGTCLHCAMCFKHMWAPYLNELYLLDSFLSILSVVSKLEFRKVMLTIQTEGSSAILYSMADWEAGTCSAGRLRSELEVLRLGIPNEGSLTPFHAFVKAKNYYGLFMLRLKILVELQPAEVGLVCLVRGVM